MNIDSHISNFANKRIFLTGNTGFKGTWLSYVLKNTSTESIGYSIAPTGMGRLGYDPGIVLPTIFGNILDLDKLTRSMQDFSPQIVIHFAAQSLLQKSYNLPRETFEVNVMGTYNVLESALKTNSVEIVLIITSDKVYLPITSNSYLSENSNLGGKDPYSASKVAAKMATEVIKSLKDHRNLGIKIITGRAGNVIGGGDQSESRLLPDIVESLMQGTDIQLRNPTQVRPWQHVLESIFGYLKYINHSYNDTEMPSALNFGPNKVDHLTVENVARMASDFWNFKDSKITFLPTNLPKENKQILLNSELAKKSLGWTPSWDTKNAVKLTLNWWQNYFKLDDKKNVSELYQNDIALFFQ